MSEGNDVQERQAPGWDAIDEQLQRLYKEQEPKHFGTMIPYRLGGPDPLDGMSVYERDEPVPHWHFVTYGFSELYEKESEQKEVSGFGFELTMRLRKEGEETEPPAWALNLLQNMARYVFRSGNVFRDGDYMDANGPIALESDTALTALAFTADPELAPIQTANGHVSFLQMTGITQEELEAMQIWNTHGVLQAAHSAGLLPIGMTDLLRPSLMQEEAMQRKVEEGAARDGSSTGFLFVDQLRWEEAKKKLFRGPSYTLTLGAKQASLAGRLLKGRLEKEKFLTLSSKTTGVRLQPGPACSVEKQDELIKLFLSEAAIEELAEKLQPKAGSFSVEAFKGLTVQIVPTAIKDEAGKVVKTIG